MPAKSFACQMRYRSPSKAKCHPVAATRAIMASRVISFDGMSFLTASLMACVMAATTASAINTRARKSQIASISVRPIHGRAESHLFTVHLLQTARPRRDLGNALGGAAEHPDFGRFPTGL